MGGMETYAKELSEELAKVSSMTLVTLPGNADGSAPGPWALIRFAFRAALKSWSQGTQDIIHGADMAIWPLVLLARLRSPRARIMLSAHGTDVSYGQRPGWLPLFYAGYQWLGAFCLPAAVVLANSAITQQMTQLLGYRTVRKIPLAARSLECPAHAITPNRTMLFAGRVLPRKGLGWFVREVLPRLPQDMDVAVAGTVWDVAEASVLQHPRVRNLGRLSHRELTREMSGSLCVIAPNIPLGAGHFEGFGLVAVESALAGGVIVASEMDGFLDSVAPGVTGFLIPSKSPLSWAEKIMEIAAWSPEQRKAFIQESRRQAASLFCWERVARETAAAYGL